MEAALGDDHVVEDPNADHLARLLEPLGDLPVLTAGGWVTARMVVDEHEGCGRASDRRTKHLPRMHEAGRQGALGDEYLAHHPVTSVDEQRQELLVGTVSQAREEVAVHVRRSVDARARLEPSGGEPPADLARRHE